MTLLPALLILVLSLQGTTQSQVPFDKSLPIVPKIEYDLGENTWTTVSFQFVRIEDLVDTDSCSNFCQGTKHDKHESCDNSCDEPHAKLHYAVKPTFGSVDIRGRIKPFLNAFGYSEGSSDIGLSLEYSIAEYANDTVKASESLAALNPKFGLGHWATEPCTTRLRFITFVGLKLVAQIQLFRRTLRPNGSWSTVDGPKLDLDITILRVPLPSPSYETKTICNCAIVQTGMLPTEALEVGGVFMDPDTKDGNNEMQFCNAELQGTVGLTCTADSMTSCTFTATNPTVKEIEICVYPGTEMICSDDKTQNIGTCGTARLVIPPGKAGPFLPSSASVKVRAVCLNMNKKEPDGSSKFKIGGPSSDPLRRLARFSEKERFKSVVEQMRVWIVTDQATLADMQKHLMFPKPTPGQYLRALETVATVALDDLTDAKYAKCLDPSLISGAPTTVEAWNRFVGLMEKANPQGLSKAASNPKTFDALWTEDATKFGAEHAAWVANALGHSSNLALQTASGNFLMNILPVARREEVALSGGLSAVGSWLLGADEVRANKSLEILSAYRSKSSLLYLLNPNPMLPEPIRLEAKKLADELLVPPHGTLQESVQFLYSYNKP